jgi:transcriptional regulator with XRE-family HTH domain
MSKETEKLATIKGLPPRVVEIDPARGEPRALTKQEFGRRLQAVLLDKGWNQSELARRAHLGRDAISTYVRGRSFPEPASLRRIADAFGMDPAELLPNSLEAAIERDTPSLEIKEAVGHPGLAWLRVNRRVTVLQALQVMQILMGDQEGQD